MRIVVRFDDGQEQRVPPSRLKVPWGQRELYERSERQTAALAEHVIDDVEQAAIERVFLELIPDAVAEIQWRPVEGVCHVLDSEGLERLTQLPLGELLRGVVTFEQAEHLAVAPVGTVLIAEAVCRANPQSILSYVDTQETKARHKVKHGGQSILARRGEDRPTSPAYEYEWYLCHDRPIHELLRQWCGYRAVALHDRLQAAEAETGRLDALLARALEALRDCGDATTAEVLEREHEEERITAARRRAPVERPLQPHEVPHVEVPRLPRWR